MLQAHDKTFFDTFGYLVLPGALNDDIGWIIEDFEAAWKARSDIVHDGSKRTMFPANMISTTPRLTTLLEHPVIVDALDVLIGSGWSFSGGDGNFYSGDTGWHPDTLTGLNHEQSVVKHAKIAFYLDPLTRDTGALRVIPCSHLCSEELRKNVPTMNGPEVPAAAVESNPGDLVVFDHRLWHASFGGSKRRRMFTMNLFADYHNEVEREALLATFRWYRDTLGVDWTGMNPWIATLSEGQRKRLKNTMAFGREAANEKKLSAVV